MPRRGNVSCCPPNAEVVAKLAKRYANQSLGEITVREDGRRIASSISVSRKSPVATRKNDDGTTTMYTVAPGLDGFEFVVCERDGKRALVLRDNQHEYVFVEGKLAL